MAKGPRPKATAVKEAEGSFTRHPERRNKREPKVNSNSPEPTETVSSNPVALAKFKHVVSILEEMRVISTVDVDLIESYSLIYAEAIENTLLLREEGYMVESNRGGLVRNPRAVALAALRNQQHKLFAEMGLTPSSRTRLQAAPDDSEDVFAQLMQTRESLN